MHSQSQVLSFASIACAIVLLTPAPMLPAQNPTEQPPATQPPATQPPATQPPSTQGTRTPEPGFRSRIVDVIVLENKDRLFGILSPDQETRMLMRSDWLRANAAKLFDPDFDTCLKNAVAEQPQSSSLLNKLQQEVAQLDNASENERRLAQILQETCQRIQQQATESPALVIVEIPKEMVRRRQSQPENIQQLGVLAFLNALPEPELMSRTEATQQLRQLPAAMLVTELPNQSDQSDQQLMMVMTAADFRADRKGTIIQSGDTFVADDGTAAIEALLPALLQQSMQKQISDLLGEGTPGSSSNAAAIGDSNPQSTKLDPQAAEIAQRKNWTTVELTSFSINLDADSAQVTRSIFHLHDQTWLLVHRVSSAATSADLSEEQQVEIRNDPQIKSVLQLFGQLGTSDAQVTRAISLGAVVKTASARSADQVQDFVSGCLRGEFSGRKSGKIPTLKLRQKSP